MVIIRYAARSSRIRRRNALRRLAGDRLDHPVEVEAREVQPGGQLLAGRLVVVERLGEAVDEAREVSAADVGTTCSSVPILTGARPRLS